MRYHELVAFVGGLEGDSSSRLAGDMPLSAHSYPFIVHTYGAMQLIAGMCGSAHPTCRAAGTSSCCQSDSCRQTARFLGLLSSS